ncbi:hypothetical protein XF_2467 [Xylella fastidiosa 9a5c]|uniref:Uncharacterized protein n=1 Tax=Xylella fastidiosa (strain 9a5c) TaxID=160492 RepID=Q9PAM9_XYLFA|nr:hypothetical protein XF_2467 [Xylella fastidiosa 9a5c]
MFPSRSASVRCTSVLEDMPLDTSIAIIALQSMSPTQHSQQHLMLVRLSPCVLA